MNSKHPLWTIRSKEEASQFWEAEFGDGKDSGSRSADHDDAGDKTFSSGEKSNGTPVVA